MKMLHSMPSLYKTCIIEIWESCIRIRIELLYHVLHENDIVPLGPSGVAMAHTWRFGKE